MRPTARLLWLCVFLVPAAARADVASRDIRDLWPALPKPRLALAPTPKPPAIDGTVGEAEWRAASTAREFIGVDAPKWKGVAGFDYVSAQTTVHVTYDARKLYVAFRCDEPEIETLAVNSQPLRDQPLWRDDCVELFVRPAGAKRYAHFIINSKGYVYDALQVAGEKSGKDWNCERLSVAAKVSPAGKGSHWTVELALPFAALGAEAPEPGEVWGVNFARERYAAMYRAIGEYSTWSGLVGSFNTPEMFGEMCFATVRQDVRLAGGAPEAVRPFLGLHDLAGRFTNLAGQPRKVTLAVKTASAAGVKDAGSAEAVLPPGKAARASVSATIAGEGPQIAALTVTDAATGKLLSCTRIPFEISDVFATAGRVRGRLAALGEKAGKGTPFAEGISEQLSAVAAATAEAEKLRAALAGRGAADADREAWAKLRRRLGEMEAATTFVLWTNSPYIATGADTMPPAFGPPQTLRIAAAQNEYANVVLNVTNLTDRDIEFQLDGELPGQVGPARSGLLTPPQVLAVHQPKLLGVKVKDIPEKPTGRAMPLIELNGLGTFFVRPYSTRQIWLTVQTADIRPGGRRGSLKLRPLNMPLPAIPVPWELEVWKVRIADEAPIGVFCFDYAGDYEAMKRYKINVWFRSAFPHGLKLDDKGELKTPYRTDIKRVKQRIDQGAEKFLFSYGYAGSFIAWAEKSGIDYMSPRFKRIFKEVLSRMVAEWLEAGLDYDDFVLQSIDEAHGRGVQQVIDTTPLIREVDPKVRLGMTIMTGLDELRKMAPHVDVWLNRNGAIWGDEQKAFFDAERAKGKPIWSWNMPDNPKSKPITQFRTYGWRAMKFDFDAIGFFLYFGLVYQPQRPGGAIATRHWEAWRDGVEDYQLLRALRDEIDAAEKRGAPAGKVKEARGVLAGLVDDAIGERYFPDNTQATHDRIEAARARAAAEIQRVRKLK